jgi:hypothetical protein
LVYYAAEGGALESEYEYQNPYTQQLLVEKPKKSTSFTKFINNTISEIAEGGEAEDRDDQDRRLLHIEKAQRASLITRPLRSDIKKVHLHQETLVNDFKQ